MRVKLKNLDKWNDRRRSEASLYNRLLSQVDGIEPSFVEEHNKPSFNYYTIHLIDSRLERNQLRRHLESKGIQTMVYYPLSLHLQEVYSSLGYKYGDFPQSEQAQEQVLSLPMYAELRDTEIVKVVEAFRKCLK